VREGMKMIRVSDLHDQTRYNGPRSILRCSVCGTEASANKGDYFQLPETHVFRCCNMPMARVVKETRWKHVDADHI
jgi:hypothetical protein